MAKFNLKIETINKRSLSLFHAAKIKNSSNPNQKSTDNVKVQQKKLENNIDKLEAEFRSAAKHSNS